MEDLQKARQDFDKAQEYKRLNELISEKKKVSDQIQSLHQQLNSLRRKYTLLDEEFSKEVVKVQPTEVVTFKKPQVSPEKAMLSKIQSALKKSPELGLKLQDLMDFGSLSLED